MEQNQPKRITYLFGAGASIGNGRLLNDLPTGIPVVEKFNEDIKLFLAELDKTSLMIPDDDTQIQFGSFKKLLNDTFNSFSGMYSFDTYAKSLFEKGEVRQLSNLKLLLKAYLVYRQIVCEPDPRYDLLFATLINNKRLPTHVNFLSWNYDTQVELSLSKFSKLGNHKFLDFVQLGFKPRDQDYSSLLKLNGTISIKKDLSKYEFCEIDSFENTLKKKEAALIELSRFYITDDRSYHEPKLFFSWERKKEFEDVLEYSQEIIEKTDIMIVVGYSFPTLNRKIDKLILEKLPKDAKIYVQCGNEINFNEIKSKIESLAPKFGNVIQGFIDIKPSAKVIYIPQNKEFYVPFEFEN